MKLIRFGEPGSERPGVLLPDGRRVDASTSFDDYDEEFFESDGMARLEQWVASESSGAPEILSEVRLGPAVARPSKLICIGLNFSDHAAESGMDPPAEPVLFFKATTAWNGPNDQLLIPRDSEKTDWEVELAFVVGKKAQYVEEKDALDYVAGYALHNDYSERAWQLEGTGQWVKGKSADTYAPFGPFLATPDEIGDVNDLGMWLKVNGETKQDGNTSKFIFDIPHLISYLSRHMTLLPGDVVSTGTPPGVGLGFDPPQFLKPGDVIELGIEGLGEQRQEAVAWSPGS